MGFGIFIDSIKRDWRTTFSERSIDTSYQYREKIDYYSYKLDSLLEINPRQAELFSDRLYEKFKNEPKFVKYKGISLMYQDKYELAINEFKKFKMGNSYREDLEVNFGLGICHERLNNYDSAIFYYKKDDRSLDNMFRIFWCYEKQSKNDSAVFFLKKMKSRLKDDPNALNNIDLLDFINRKIDSLK